MAQSSPSLLHPAERRIPWGDALAGIVVGVAVAVALGWWLRSSAPGPVLLPVDTVAAATPLGRPGAAGPAAAPVHLAASDAARARAASGPIVVTMPVPRAGSTLADIDTAVGSAASAASAAVGAASAASAATDRPILPLPRSAAADSVKQTHEGDGRAGWTDASSVNVAEASRDELVMHYRMALRQYAPGMPIEIETPDNDTTLLHAESEDQHERWAVMIAPGQGATGLQVMVTHWKAPAEAAVGG